MDIAALHRAYDTVGFSVDVNEGIIADDLT